MKGMEGNADENKDGTITFAEMHSYLTKSVVRFAMTMNRIQEPQLFGDGSRVLIGNFGPASVNQQSVTGGAVIKDCPECPEMVVIPAGSFVMGSENRADEKPPHSVNIRSFLIGKTEVTQKLWSHVMGSNPSKFKECGPECPVENVSWDNVHNFIRKLNQQTGKVYRLPSEAEWEYAARAGTTTDWSFGNEESRLGDYAWYYENSGGNPHAVGQKLPNAFGLYDMHGNVWEWTQDCWHASYADAPTDGSSWSCNHKAYDYVRRGGSWEYGPAFLRSASRPIPNRLLDDLNGFRLVRDLFNAEAGSIAEQESKQAEDPGKATDEKAAEAAARKQKDKEVAARIERARQRKEQEDRISKMAKELENKELTEGAKKRILKGADVEITALDTAFNLVAKVSDRYAASIQAAIRPNITFDPSSLTGNPAVEILVGLTADGAIIAATVVKSSGAEGWDTAAMRAVRKTERLPKDENGRVPPTLALVLRPRER